MEVKKMTLSNQKCLIAYFSRPGKNYVGGTIVDLPVGNTEVVAKTIQKMIKGDLFHIESVNAYPVEYAETTEVAKEELRTKARPKLTGHVETLTSYDVIFMPMPVYTFLEEYNFSGKILAPFCTHEGSGLGHSVADIRKMCPQSTVRDGLAIRGGEVKNAQDSVAGWLREIGITKKK